MKVLVACEFSGIVRDAFIAKGHDAWSCDLLPTEKHGPHIQGDVLEILDGGWDLMIAHPPCKYLALCQAWRCNRDAERANRREEAVQFATTLWGAPIKLKCIENPKSQLSTMMAPKSHTIHPWQFGYREMKETWLWLYGLPHLIPTDNVGPPPKRDDPERKKWEKIWRMSPSPNRSQDRSRTYQGIANAMADQWSNL